MPKRTDDGIKKRCAQKRKSWNDCACPWGFHRWREKGFVPDSERGPRKMSACVLSDLVALRLASLAQGIRRGLP